MAGHGFNKPFDLLVKLCWSQVSLLLLKRWPTKLTAKIKQVVLKNISHDLCYVLTVYRIM